MKTRPLLMSLALAALFGAGAGGYGLYVLGMQRGMGMSAGEATLSLIHI